MSAIDVFRNKGIKVPSHFTLYATEIQIENLIVGGVPSTPNTIRGWLKTSLDKIDGTVKDVALEQLVEQTLRERFANEQPTVDELITALMADPDAGLAVNGFKRIPETGELGYESRCMKSGLKESINSCYPGVDWDGKKSSPGIAPRKGLKSTGEERIFVLGTYIGLGTKADEVQESQPEIPVVGSAWREERIKRVQTPTGPKSAINRVEVVYRPRLTFQVAVADDFLSQDAWFRVWERLEKIGIGADRGRSDGMFSLERWDSLGKVGEGVTVEE